MFLSLLFPCYHYPIKHSWQCKQVINRLTGRFWKKLGAEAGLVHGMCIFGLLPSPPLFWELSQGQQIHNALSPTMLWSLWIKVSPRGGGRSIMMVRISFIQQQDEPGMRNQTQNWSWQNIWQGVGGQRQHGLHRVANGRECQSAKGLPHVVWLLL